MGVLLALAWLSPAATMAQGGPPLVTDDPETPGDGHWEINLAALKERTPGRTLVMAPDADINYGAGESVQLKADIPWNFARSAGEPWKSGLGTPSLGVKWRFVDEADAGFSLSTYPQTQWNWVPSSASRGVATEGRQSLLPVEGSIHLGAWTLDGEVGRNLVAGGPDEWIAGGILAHACGPGDAGECMFEIHDTRSRDGSRMLFNMGTRWRLGPGISALAAAGREASNVFPDRRSLLLYLGVQLTRE